MQALSSARERARPTAKQPSQVRFPNPADQKETDRSRPHSRRYRRPDNRCGRLAPFGTPDDVVWIGADHSADLHKFGHIEPAFA